MRNQESNKQIIIPPQGEKKLLVVLGGGESGVGAAILGKQKGFEVLLSDKGRVAKKYKDVLSQYHINFEEGKH